MLTLKIKIIFSVLVITSLAAGYALVNFSDIQDRILPNPQSLYPWRPYPTTDGEFKGESFIDVKDSAYNISFDFNLTTAIQYPYATLALIFEDESNPNNVEDWSSYSSIELRVKCRPENILHLTLFTYDDQITKLQTDLNTFRPSLAFFNCGEEWRTVRIDLNRMGIPEWWLQRHNLNLDNRDYSLNKVRAIALANSIQSPVNTPSNLIIQEFVLKGKNWPLIYTLSTLVLEFWAAFIGWLIYQFYLSRRKSDISHEVVPVTYQSLSIEPKHNRERDAVLNYMASRYSNPDLSVDIAVSELGINRIKINEILRAETGLTFTLYLNKLRLTEAARLLSHKQISVAETAFAVGYNSLSYFNRLFKKEYGCNPSAYKDPSGTESSQQT